MPKGVAVATRLLLAVTLAASLGACGDSSGCDHETEGQRCYYPSPPPVSPPPTGIPVAEFLGGICRCPEIERCRCVPLYGQCPGRSCD